MLGARSTHSGRAGVQNNCLSFLLWPRSNTLHRGDRVWYRSGCSWCGRGSMPGLCAPLPTLRRRPYGRLRTARGRCGSLLLAPQGTCTLNSLPVSRRTPKSFTGADIKARVRGLVSGLAILVGHVGSDGLRDALDNSPQLWHARAAIRACAKRPADVGDAHRAAGGNGLADR